MFELNINFRCLRSIGYASNNLNIRSFTLPQPWPRAQLSSEPISLFDLTHGEGKEGESGKEAEEHSLLPGAASSASALNVESNTAASYGSEVKTGVATVGSTSQLPQLATRVVIMDFARISGMDAIAVRSCFLLLEKLCQQHGVTIMCCGVSKEASVYLSL